MKTWVMTGASRGIGLELVSQILHTGDEVHVLARNISQAEALQRLRNENASRLFLIETDVSKDVDVARAAQALGGRTVDILVNNAGILRDVDQPLSDLRLENIAEQFAVNALAPVRVTRAFLPLLKKSPAPIVANMSSRMGSIGEASGGSYGYRMSKAALNMFTKCLSAELPAGTVLSLHPGWVKTEMGGATAPVSPEESAAGLLRVIRSATHRQSGRFFDFRDSEIEW